MKSFGYHFITVAITFISTLLLNFLVELAFSDKGEVTLSNPVKINSGYFVFIDVENYSKSSINNLMVSVPKTTDINQVSSSNTVIIEEMSSLLENNTSKIISFSTIPAGSITRIAIPTNINNDSCCVISNYKDLKLVLKNDESAVNPIMESFWNAVRTSFIYSILAIILLYYMWLKTEEIREQLKEADLKFESASEKLEKSIERAHTQSEILKKEISKSKYILHKKLSDYSRELFFWRDTIRKILYSDVAGFKKSEDLIDLVTNNLKTYTTRSKLGFDFNVADALEKELLGNEKK